MFENTDTPDNFFDLLDSVLQATIESISRITNNGIALGNSLRTLDPHDLTVFEQNLVDVSIQHESSSIDSTDPRKTLGNAT